MEWGRACDDVRTDFHTTEESLPVIGWGSEASEFLRKTFLPVLGPASEEGRMKEISEKLGVWDQSWVTLSHFVSEC